MREIIRSWRKSSYSTDTTCVQVSSQQDTVFVRDSKNIDGSVLTFSIVNWNGFLASIRDESI